MFVFDANTHLVQHKVCLGNFFGRPEEDVFVVLKEMNERQFSAFQRKAGVTEGMDKAQRRAKYLDQIDSFAELFEGIILEHNFYRAPKNEKDEPIKLTEREVAEILRAKFPVTMHLIREYSEHVLFTLVASGELPSAESSGTSPIASSEDSR